MHKHFSKNINLIIFINFNLKYYDNLYFHLRFIYFDSIVKEFQIILLTYLQPSSILYALMSI